MKPKYKQAKSHLLWNSYFTISPCFGALNRKEGAEKKAAFPGAHAEGHGVPMMGVVGPHAAHAQLSIIRLAGHHVTESKPR